MTSWSLLFPQNNLIRNKNKTYRAGISFGAADMHIHYSWTSDLYDIRRMFTLSIQLTVHHTKQCPDSFQLTYNTYRISLYFPSPFFIPQISLKKYPLLQCKSFQCCLSFCRLPIEHISSVERGTTLNKQKIYGKP